MRIGIAVMAALTLTTGAVAQTKPFNATEFAKRMTIEAKTPLRDADWKKFDTAFGKCSASASQTAFVSCMNAELKRLSASFSIKS